jgi:hypothetical protein
MKKKSMGSSLLILLLSLVVFGGGIGIYTATRNANTSGFYNNSIANRRMFTDIEEFDPYTSYPNTPEDVVELYINAYWLIHGRIIHDVDMLGTVIDYTRHFLYPAFAELNPPDDYREAFLDQLAIWDEVDVYVLRPEQNSTRFETRFIDGRDRTCAVIDVTVRFSRADDGRKMVYLCEDDEGRWKVFHVGEIVRR